MKGTKKINQKPRYQKKEAQHKPSRPKRKAAKLTEKIKTREGATGRRERKKLKT